MRRDVAMAQARIAGYHHDKAAYTRLLITSHVNRVDLQRAYLGGVTAKTRGIPCDCLECDQGGA